MKVLFKLGKIGKNLSKFLINKIFLLSLYLNN
nr:MAG TPA: hypothetical protein [Crassvirales sp.]